MADGEAASDFLVRVLRPNLVALAGILGDVPPDSPKAQLQLLAEAGQETGWRDIQQTGGGPGAGPWQFEPPTCALLLRHPVVGPMLVQVCTACGVPATGDAIYAVILRNPLIAVALARLDLYSDQGPIPGIGDEDGAWECYVRVWRPGAVTRGGPLAAQEHKRWHENYTAASAAIEGKQA